MSWNPIYQIARLRIQRGLTQSQLAELVGTRLSLLDRLAKALNAQIELHILPR
jgi:transcriptional regulator with XRE-family HTH domain